MKYWMQYHNYDKLGYLPGTDACTDLKDLDNFDTNNINDFGITTKKRIKNDIIHDTGILIVGIGKNPKKYYLWSKFLIDEAYEDEYGINLLGENGIVLNPPIKLNKIKGFNDFFNHCGHFGLGFQNITKDPFTKQLLKLSENNISSKFVFLNSITEDLKSEDLNITEIEKEMNKVNELMERITPEQDKMLFNTINRKDNRIIKLLKITKDFLCQFPNCEKKILTKNGKYYIEVAHITPVSDGGKSILSNLIVLCPNHHKEFDYGDLNITFRDENKIEGILNGVKFVIKL